MEISLNESAKLTSITPNPDCSCVENVAELQRFRNYRFIKGNILSSDLVKFVLEEERIDTILHFAAQYVTGSGQSWLCR